MRVPVWVADMAATFWAAARRKEPFPRRLLEAIRAAVPLSVMFPSQPLIENIQTRLARLGIAYDFAPCRRTLRACLIASHGHGLAFVDGGDTEDEQRFSIAHELAHFLRDYQLPRQRVASRLGPAAVEVLDGTRPATVTERLQSALMQTPLGVYLHLMERDAEQKPLTAGIADAEDCADRLAFELLAPAGEVMAVTGPPGASVVDALISRFGFPPRQAAQYARLLVPPPAPAHPLLRGLTVVS